MNSVRVLLVVAGAIASPTPGPVALPTTTKDRPALDALAAAGVTDGVVLARGEARVFYVHQGGVAKVLAVVGGTVLPLMPMTAGVVQVEAAPVARFLGRRDLLLLSVTFVGWEKAARESNEQLFVVRVGRDGAPSTVACHIPGSRSTAGEKTQWGTNVSIKLKTIKPLTFDVMSVSGGQNNGIFFDGVPQHQAFEFTDDGSCRMVPPTVSKTVPPTESKTGGGK